MTRAQLSTLILSWLDDEQQGYFSATDVNTWINNAQFQVQMKLLNAGNNWYMRPVETFCVASQSDYILPSDFMFEHRLEVVLSGTGPTENRQRISFITTNQQDNYSLSTGIPTAAYLKKDRFTLQPAPDQAYKLRLYYSPIIATLVNDTDVPDVPPQFMEYLAILAAYDGFIKDDRAPANLVAKHEAYEELLKKMAINRTQDAPRQIVQVGDYSYGDGGIFGF